MRPQEVSDRLELGKIAKDHVWKVEPSCATTGEGIFEGLVCWITYNYMADHTANNPQGMAIQQRQTPSRQQINHPSRLSPSPPKRLHAHIWLPAYTRLPIIMPSSYYRRIPF